MTGQDLNSELIEVLRDIVSHNLYDQEYGYCLICQSPIGHAFGCSLVKARALLDKIEVGQ